MLFSNSISIMIHVVNAASNIAGTMQPVSGSFIAATYLILRTSLSGN
jgi:hypothetical protein